MTRLPSYDVGTRRSELAVFAIIGAAGLAVLAGAVNQAVRFAEGRDGIVAALTPPPAQTAEMVARHSTNPPPTNASARRSLLPVSWIPGPLCPRCSSRTSPPT